MLVRFQADTAASVRMTSETSASFHHSTRRCNPEDSHVRSHSSENLKFCIYPFETIILFTSFPILPEASMGHRRYSSLRKKSPRFYASNSRPLVSVKKSDILCPFLHILNRWWWINLPEQTISPGSGEIRGGQLLQIASKYKHVRNTEHTFWITSWLYIIPWF